MTKMNTLEMTAGNVFKVDEHLREKLVNRP